MANEENLRNRKPFVKNDPRINREGYPKGVPHSKTRYLRLLSLIQNKTNVFTGEEETFSLMEQIDMILFDKALKGDVKAYREILNRLEGRAGGQNKDTEVKYGKDKEDEEKYVD